MVLGVVSNAWAALLPESSLEAQCREAVARGYRYVELRQRALAECEETVAGDDRPWPKPEALARLAAACPELGMNLALEAPFMTARVDPGEPYIQRCVAAAKALDSERPILRFVDLSPAPELLGPERIAELAESAAGLAAALWRYGVRLALENSRQPVRVLRELIRNAAGRLPAGTPVPTICWDPMNQRVQQLEPEDPHQTARELRAEELFEYHFKQGAGGVVQPDVGPGELDWAAITHALHAGGFRGPALFEIPAGPDIWERLERSTAHIRGLAPA